MNARCAAVASSFSGTPRSAGLKVDFKVIRLNQAYFSSVPGVFRDYCRDSLTCLVLIDAQQAEDPVAVMIKQHPFAAFLAGMDASTPR